MCMRDAVKIIQGEVFYFERQSAQFHSALPSNFENNTKL